MSHPIRDPQVQDEIERRAKALTGYSAGKMTVELNLKDGVWRVGNISVTWPRHHGSRTSE